MKYFILILSILQCSIAFPQSDEFKIYQNGLIYNDTTMHQLQVIVDSINLDFNRCDLDREYLSVATAKGISFNVAKEDVNAAYEDLKNGIGFHQLVKKYPNTKINEERIFRRSHHKIWRKDKVGTKFTDILNDKRLMGFDSAYIDSQVKGETLFAFEEKSKYSDASLKGIYFITEFESLSLPKKYARMVQYSECMIDTTARILLSDAENNKYNEWERGPKIEAFYQFIDTGLPDYPKKNKKETYKEFGIRRNEYLEEQKIVREQNSQRSEFQKYLLEAINEGLTEGGSTESFEALVGQYYSKETELQLKRSREVWGQCSMDSRPRDHAFEIAQLSAETINWEIFLRAHMDIMNDNFSRMSDGSYAQGGRNTYIKELEELNFNVKDLLLGITLRVENCGPKHYYGSIRRLGRALAETKYQEDIEQEMLSMIKDESLDTYNRILIYYLHLNYIYYLDETVNKDEKVKELYLAKKTFPKNIRDELQEFNE
ncbi:hypothetical protein MY04_4532 [Flammeovirga sp. MY04]|uniref:hypothetical protein n=1 Tax=Flammeovirga sp. MY04 TaxID=1191459 RepID=UPI0008063406|nr:hypothetical protein [Flammeovirga sp. MY04]ANQ51867.1 hypothetical protein MY04_4532 [Flammeovirga sp. MY04]